MLKNNCNMTLYELWKGKLDNIKYFKIFGIKCYIKREDQKFGKFDSHVDEGIFVAYRCCNIRWKQIVERINFNFDEDCVTKDNDEIVPSRKSKGFEVEYVKDEEEVIEQDQSNKETIVNHEEIINDQ